MIPSLESEHAHFGTYEIEGAKAIELAAYIRSIGYHAQIHNPSDNSGSFIAMFVAAGLGQLGANGQLLSPHFGSRARLMLITTDAPVTYDEPEDYGDSPLLPDLPGVRRPVPGPGTGKGEGLVAGVEKNKLVYDRCRPVMARYEGCGVCMKVCPIQRYGMKPVMEHYVETGEVLGKGTDNLEGFEMRGRATSGPASCPTSAKSSSRSPTVDGRTGSSSSSRTGFRRVRPPPPRICRSLPGRSGPR